MDGHSADSAAGRKATVLLVDDHEIVRRGLAQLIAQDPGLTVCGEAATVQEALRAAAELRPDAAVVDLSLGEEDGLDLIKDLHIRFPDTRVLVLSMHDETFYAERVLRAGARGYVMKDRPAEEFVAALRKVLRNEIAVSTAMADRALQAIAGGKRDLHQSPVDALTDRELQVFRLIGQGLSTGEIAARLHLSVKTVETYRAHLKEKLQVRDASGLLQYAIQWAQSEKGS
jgi:DNA-binding NarL/FixJ family response regulator